MSKDDTVNVSLPLIGGSTPVTAASPTSTGDSKASPETIQKAEIFLANYFDSAINQGVTGYGLWCEDNLSQLLKTSFFAPTQWQLLSSSPFLYYGPTGVASRVRVHSSNKGGLQIVNVWTISTKQENGKACIASVTE